MQTDAFAGGLTQATINGDKEGKSRLLSSEVSESEHPMKSRIADKRQMNDNVLSKETKNADLFRPADSVLPPIHAKYLLSPQASQHQAF